MKIKLLKYGVKNPELLTQGISIAQNLTKAIGFPLDITVVEVSKQFTGTFFSNPVVGKGICVTPEQILDFSTGNEDIACLVFDWNLVSPQPTNPCQTPIRKGTCTPIQIPEQWNGIPMNPVTFAEFFLHEICHSMYYLLGIVSQDMTHLMTNMTLDPIEYAKWSQKTPTDYYLNLISKLAPKWNEYSPMQTYKYFKPKEIVNLNPEFVAMLDSARGFSGIPFVISSGYRTTLENKLVGGVQGSTHTLGLAVDVVADTSEKRFKIVSGAIKAGFTRIGVYNGHCHLDKGSFPDFPQNVLWVIDKD